MICIPPNKEVQVILAHGANKIELSAKLRRAELTRSEILGRIRMLPLKKKGGFSIDYLATPDFLQQIDQIVEGSGAGILTIVCEKDELEQFDISSKRLI